MSRLYPLFVDIRGRLVVVVGGGRVAQRKVATLLECGARVRVVGPRIVDELALLGAEGKAEIMQRSYCVNDLDGAWLVIAASDDEQVNQAVYSRAEELGILCNVVDQPELCSFHVPSVVRRGRLQIAISTGGVSPALAKRLREQLEHEFDGAYVDLLDALASLRAHVKQQHPDDQARRAEILTGFLDSGALELLRSGDRAGFERVLEEWHAL